MKHLRTIALILAALLLLSGCGAPHTEEQTTTASTTLSSTQAPETAETTTEDTTDATETTLPPDIIPTPSHNINEMPRHINGGAWNSGHVQGMAIDTAREYMYFSFTTILVKTDMSGKVIGTVTGITDHLGDLDFNDVDGRVYGSLEYKSQNAFYIAIFDVDKITRMNMDAKADGIMTAVYLPEVVEDYTATVGDNLKHRYGCSGIDGIAFGPTFGKDASSPFSLMISCGVFNDVTRTDNDHQILLEFDWRALAEYEKPLDPKALHREGPTAKARYFVYTGNTNYGIQTLEYDAYTGDWFMAVYKGKKPEFPNLPLYVVDGSIAPVEGEIVGQPTPERGLLLTLKKGSATHKQSGVTGWSFGYGNTGFVALDDGYFYVAHNSAVDGKQTCDAYLYRFTGKGTEGFAKLQ